MRNLSIVDYLHYGKAFPSICLNSPCLAIDSDSECAYCSTHDGVVALDMRSKSVVRELDLKSRGMLVAPDYIVGLHYRLDDMSLCIALSNGDILSWSSASDVECVGSIGEGIAAMSWSPDGELLTIFSQSNEQELARVYVIVCHGPELQPLTDFPFSTDNFGEAEFVTVGWGKKETQFHGSEGKHAATQKEAVQMEVRNTDDKKPRIRWIGDGRYFAGSAIDSVLGTRKIRVWTREGILHSTSEMVTGLEHSLDWRPSGNLIASSQTHKNKHDIVFFERNGLRHGQFTLPFPIDTVKVREVFWNNESNILCVWMEEMQTSKTFVQYWTMNNYHWYLKQSLRFSEDDDRPVYVCWDVMDGSVLYLLCKDGSLTRYSIDWVTASNSCAASGHETAVIDGSNLYMTPFSAMVVPPPMCAYSIQLSSYARSVSFCPTKNQMAVLVCTGDVLICQLATDNDCAGQVHTSIKLEAAGGSGFTRKCCLPTDLASYSLPESLQLISQSLRHVCWLTANQLCLISTRQTGANWLVVLGVNTSTSILDIVQEKEVGQVKTVCGGEDKIVVQYTDGSVWVYQNNEYSAYCPPGESTPLVFPVLCNQIQFCTFAGQEALIGLSQRYRLFVNDLEIATNCTSFAVHDDFLLLTSHNHTIRCVNRGTAFSKMTKLADNKAHIFDETVRRVERGSRIVTCIADGTKVVLQMPRGNLEVIHPRALVLSTIRKMLDRLEYKQAFMLMHRHRIKMNLICDHNRKLFLDNVRLFIEQLQSVTYLNQFISDLCEEDVTATMYTAFYDQSSSAEQNNSKSPSKVDIVCDGMVTALGSINFDKYLLCILTAHVRKTEPQLETALTIIKSLSDKNQVEESLKYLMYLVDVNELFDVALGMYDFDLVLMVAEKSQKDPKEYLMFLNEVRQLETNYQRYTIDRHLKRYSKALTHICKCGSNRFVELLSLVKEHSLYREALDLLSPKSQERQEVLIAFADYLNGKKRSEEAGILYAQADQHKLAVDCLIESGSWQRCVVSMQKLSLSNTEYLQYVTSLAEKLKTMRMYGDAAILLESYAEQPEEAITTLIAGSLWNEAMRLIGKHARHDFIETDWKPAVEERYQQLVSSTQNDTKDLLAYKDRFMKVLQANRSKADLIGDEFRDVDADMYSDTSSMTGVSAISSSHSRSTGRTSKNQRKAQRKKWSLKEGSKFEDLALLDEMKKLVVRIDSMRDEIRALLLALVSVEQLAKAENLQTIYSEAISSVIALIPGVWSSEVVNSSAQLTGEQSTVNSILKSMAQLNSQTPANPAATSAELEVKRAPVVSSDSTWRLSMLSKFS